MDSPFLDKLDIIRKLGTEQFSLEGQNLGISLLDFWSWSSSDLVSNTLRGILAEFLVAHDLGISQTLRTEWDAYDLVTAEGIKIEIKSAAYLQSWKQKTSLKSSLTYPKHGDGKRVRIRMALSASDRLMYMCLQSSNTKINLQSIRLRLSNGNFMYCQRPYWTTSTQHKQKYGSVPWSR